MSQGADFSTRPTPRSGARRLETPALALAAVLFAASALSATQAVRERRAAAAAVSDLRRQVAASRNRVETLLNRQRGTREALSAQLVGTAEAPPGRLLAELSDLLPPDVRLESVAFAYGQRLEIDAQLVARRPAAYDLFLERVAESQLFDDVLPGLETREGEMRASVRMSYRRAP